MYQNLGPILDMVFIASGHSHIVHIKLIAEIWLSVSIAQKNFDEATHAIAQHMYKKVGQNVFGRENGRQMQKL